MEWNFKYHLAYVTRKLNQTKFYVKIEDEIEKIWELMMLKKFREKSDDNFEKTNVFKNNIRFTENCNDGTRNSHISYIWCSLLLTHYTFVIINLPVWIHFVVLVVRLLTRVWLFMAPWTVACQPPLSVEFSRQDYWSGLPFPSPRDLPDPGIKPHLLH